MARKAFYISGFKDHFVDHALQIQREGVCREGVENTQSTAQVTKNAQGNRVGRVIQQDSAIGLDSVDVHMSGDRCVVTAEIPQSNGDIVQYIERYSDGGKFIGSYEVPWRKIGEGKHEKDKPRRIWY